MSRKVADISTKNVMHGGHHGDRGQYRGGALSLDLGTRKPFLRAKTCHRRVRMEKKSCGPREGNSKGRQGTAHTLECWEQQLRNTALAEEAREVGGEQLTQEVMAQCMERGLYPRGCLRSFPASPLGIVQT